MIIIRPHCSTMYIDATCCYWPSSVVCRSVGLTQLWALLNRSRCCLSWGLRPIPAGIPAGFGGYVAIPTPVHISSGPKAACITWAADPLCEGAISRGKDMPGHAWWHPLPRPVQKWLNWLICRLGYGLGWAEESTSSMRRRARNSFTRRRHRETWSIYTGS